MNKLEIDFMIYSTKPKVLTFLISKIEGLFAPNYDALIDALRFYSTPILLCLKNISFYEDKSNLLEILQIIHRENPIFNYIVK
ncbi:MAG: hypothetical protein NC310_08310 [Roseburia sp.]|nr:hypothetical protein [Anaeroplasma bactoclasticum]MCM1197052.1 hypothetical protein [Roseburia sp.]MCM1557700.1 hypothetical protein [Anaeroplasma bactoclasticum]